MKLSNLKRGDVFKFETSELIYTFLRQKQVNQYTEYIYMFNGIEDSTLINRNVLILT